MSALNFSRYILECDGCKKRHGDPHGHNSSQEARIAAYIDGWRFPSMIKSDGSIGSRTNDVCADCMTTWAPRQWATGRGSGRRLSVDQAPRAEGEADK
ncbi:MULTISPECIES: hypothetical protein [Streptomyces]|uniref:Uncharacterized protein n=2 Tax=Streptomyces TaxID=1883 RepID=A0A2U9P0M1_STRAS|nr:hypothetical protein [Streptomyces actuosus]AWT42814.1 hypothetical protein DMT42_11095 [Streptomyces actuosus]MBM4820045.1 hypothetical protein [Streptomyces actuosus]